MWWVLQMYVSAEWTKLANVPSMACEARRAVGDTVRPPSSSSPSSPKTMRVIQYTLAILDKKIYKLKYLCSLFTFDLNNLHSYFIQSQATSRLNFCANKLQKLSCWSFKPGEGRVRMPEASMVSTP